MNNSMSKKISKYIVLFFCVFFSALVFAKESNELYSKAMQLIAENRFAEAKIILINVIENEPNHAGAWLDLAIVQCELGNKAEADRLFDTLSIQFNPPSAILEVIAQQRNRKCADNSISKQLLINIERGFDSNVNQGASNPIFLLGSGTTQLELNLLPEFLPKSDQFTSAYLSSNADISSFGISTFAHIGLRQYDQFKAFNTAHISLGVEKAWQFEKQSVFAAFHVARLILDQSLYQKQSGVQFTIAPSNTHSKKIQWSISTGATHFQYPTLLNYDSTIYEFKNRLIFEKDNYQIQSFFGYLFDTPSNSRTGGARSGSFLGLTFRNKISPKLETEISWNRQLWKSQSAYSPGLIDQVRNQITDQKKVSFIFHAGTQSNLRLELRSLKNKENISILQYNNKSILLSWNWLH